MAAGTEEALGTVCWWGLTPALDLRQHLPPDLDPAAEASVLLVGAAEGRHLLLTAARARRAPPRAITLFVAEQRPEPVARQLLFLLLALETSGHAGPAARATALLELLGSARLRARTAALLSGAAGRLRRWVTGDRHWDGPADLGLMKATTVAPGEFGRWRESGVAFVPRGEGDVPNPTLRSGRRARPDGQPGLDLGYWGDTVTGPFLAFGLDTDELRSPGKTATEISLANVTAMLHELLTGTPPAGGDPSGDQDPPEDPPGDWDPPEHGDPPGDQDPPEHRDTPGDLPGDQDPPEDPPGDRDPPCEDTSPLGPLVPLPLRVRFLPLGSARRPPARARLDGTCRLLLLGWRSLPELTPELGALAAPGATLLVELPTFVPTLRPPQLDALRAQAEALARAAGFEPWGGPGVPAACARFRRPRQP